MLYRAHYRTKAGDDRRMTFAHSGGIKAAHQHAAEWELRDDRLQRVEFLRDAERPIFELTLQGVV